ncbi:MAG: hypothetical protein CMP23_17775 [Rickettsiales bacterium]|nr:hypothetical protein [Rickettsiales bacterium]|tara:strand:- start:488 stop:1201 length:714 start_codon:yes stop_codon:yes gene_type:complete
MVASAAELRELLERRFPGSGLALMPEHERIKSGVDALDELLSGGLRLGTLTLLSGGLSCGKTSLAQAFAAHMSRQQGMVAWLHGGSFSAPSVAAAGVDLDCLLQVRVRGDRQWRECLDVLLRDAAFTLVIADFLPLQRRSPNWQRVRRLLVARPCALLLLAAPPAFADPLRDVASVHLHVSRCWSDVPGAEHIEVLLERSRCSSAGARLQLPYGVQDFSFLLAPELPGLGQDWNEEF